MKLLDELRDGDRTHREQDDHRRADDEQPDQVLGEVGHTVEGDGRILRLDGEPAAASFDDLVSRAEGHLDGSDQRLVATDARLGDAPRDARPLGAASRHPHARRQSPGRPYRLAKITLLAPPTLAGQLTASISKPF